MIQILIKYRAKMPIFRLFLACFFTMLFSFVSMHNVFATSASEKLEDRKPFVVAEGKGLEIGVIGNTIGVVYNDGNNNWDNEIRRFLTVTGNYTFDWKQNGSATNLTLPPGAKIIKAVLLYGGTASSHNIDAWKWTGSSWLISETSKAEGFSESEIKNSPIRFTTPTGITYSLSYNSELGKRHVKYREVDRYQALHNRKPDGSFNPAPVYYMVSIDVTDEVRTSGGGKYCVEGIPTRINPSLTATNAGGWSLYYIYEDPSNNNMRRASLYTGLAEVEKNWSDEPAGKITIDDFETPDSGVVNGTLILSAIEGDPGPRATGDMVYFMVGKSATDAKTNGRAQYLSTPHNLAKNFFNGIIVDNDGNIDTRGTAGTLNNIPGSNPKPNNRYGWDIAHVPLRGLLRPEDKFLQLGLYSIGESYAVHGVGFSFDIGQADLHIKKEADKKEATPGEVVNFTITVENKGGKDTTTSAKEVEVTDYFDPDVFIYDENKGKSANLLSYDNATGKCVWKMPKPIQRGEKAVINLPLVVKEDTKDIETENVAVVTSPNYIPPTDPNDPLNLNPPDTNTGTPPTITLDVGKKKHTIPKKSKISEKVPVKIKHVDLDIKKDVLKDDHTPLEKDKDDIPLVNPDETVTYKITVKNDGKHKAKKVNVKDLFPKDFQIDATKPNSGIIPSKGTVTKDPSGDYIWNIGELEPDGKEEVTLEVKVKIPTAADGIYPSNSITTPEDQVDINLKNNEATVSVKTRGADLEIKKTASENSPDIGEEFSYTIEVENHGPDKAEKVFVEDKLNSHLEYISANPVTGVNFDNTTNIFKWNIGEIPTGEKRSLVLRVKLKDTIKNEDSYGIENTAEVSTEPGGSKDPNKKNNQAKVSPVADLGLTKIVDYDATAPGKDLIYTFTAHNFGPDRALLAKVSDVLPQNVEYKGVVKNPSKGTITYDKATRTMTWEIGHMLKDETQYATIKVSINKDATGEIENRATITSKTPEPKPNPDPNAPSPTPPMPIPSPDPDNPRGPIPPTDPKNPGENNTPPPVITKLYRPADVSIEKAVDKNAAKNLDELTYTLTATNHSDIATARNVKVIDKLPKEVTYVKSVGTVSTDKYDDKTGQWLLGDMKPKEVRTLKITVQIKDNTSERTDDIRNFAEITTDSPDPNTPNNRSNTVITEFKDTDMEVKIERSKLPHPPIEGDTFYYNVTIKNNSPNPAPDVTVTDELPPELEVIGVETPPNTHYDPSTHKWKVDGVVKKEDPPRSMKLKVRVKRRPLKAIISTVRVHTSLKDTVRENNVDSTGGSADLALKKEVDKTIVTPKGTLLYTITVLNNGPDDSKEVLVKDVLPKDVKYISQKATKGAYDDYYGEWLIGDLKNGQKAVLEIETEVVKDDEGDILNKANIVPTVTDDPNPQNDSDEVKTNVKKSKYDVAVVTTIDEPNKNNFYYDTKDDKPREHKVGDKVISYVEVWNMMKEPVKNVTLIDLPDPSMKIISGDPEDGEGIFDPKTGVWTIPELQAGQKLRLKVLLDLGKGSSGIIKNTAHVSLPDGTLDQNPKNNRSVGAVAVGGADLEVIKTSFNPNPSADRPDIEFTITAINHGPLDATGVIMTETWPEGLEYIAEGSDPAYRHKAGGGTWDIGIIKNGESKSIKIHSRWRGDEEKSTLNKVTIKANEIDPNPDNDHASAGGISDLVTTEKVTDKDSNPVNRVKIGDEILYKITVENKGKDTALKSTLKSKIPDSLELISLDLPKSTPDNPRGTYDRDKGIVELGKLKPNEKVTIIFRTRVKNEARNSIEHHSHADTVTMERRKDNNDAKTSIIVGDDSKVSLEKRALRPELRRGETVPYEITITNTSLVKLENVVLEDIIPPGFSYVEDSVKVDIGASGSKRGLDLVKNLPLTFVVPEIPANSKTKVYYVLRAGALVNPGMAVNRAILKKNDIPLSNEALAQVKILEEPLFDHTLIYGHVYEDLNRNGSMDQGEVGISGVKLATVTGLIITTDRSGRYHIAGQWGGSWDRGRNFILKLDPFSLPRNAVVFTENPRTVRLTPGVPTKINFGIVYEEDTPLEEEPHVVQK